jgi:hypothetical protein
MWFTIPVIIISTLTGTANFATSQFKWEYTSSVIGAFNIGAGIISTIQHFLKVNELTEGHKFSSLSWDKFYRNIKIELSKNPADRVSAHHMLKLYKEEYDRLMETSPVINDDIIRQFNDSFNGSDVFAEVKKPEICDQMTPTLASVYKDPPAPDVPDAIIVEQPKEADPYKLRAEAVVARFRENNIKNIRAKKILDDFIVDFEKINNRKPGDVEVISNLKEKVDAEILRKLMDNTTTR